MKTGAGYQLLRLNRDIHAYDSQGLLTGIAFANGATITCAYSGTRSVTERDARNNSGVDPRAGPPHRDDGGPPDHGGVRQDWRGPRL